VYIAYSANEVIQDILDYKPQILRAHPPYLRLVAEAMKDRGVKPVSLKALFTGGAVLDEPTRQYLESFFERDVFMNYAANEIGPISWECVKKDGMHIVSDLVIVEVVRDGEPAKPGEPGEIVVTGLINYVMPLIRYRMGDVGILAEERCSCGRGFPLLHSHEGRLVDCFALPNGRTVTPKTIMTAVQGTPGVSRYRVVQENRQKVLVELMRRSTDPKVSQDDLITRCRAVLSDDVDIEVVVRGREQLKAKFRPVISRLTVDQEPRWTEPYHKTMN
jgi:phenylacetate-CoA ligase